VIRRAYYPLEKAAEILSCTEAGLSCTEADLIHLGATGELSIYMLHDQFTIGLRRFNVYGWEPIGDETYFWQDKPLKVSQSCIKALESLTPGGVADIIIEYTPDDGETLDPNERFRFSLRNTLTGAVPTIQDCILVISADDLKRLQQPEPSLTESDRDKLLKQIGVMALVLAQKSNQYAIGDGKPNAKQIANAVQVIFDAADFPGKKGTGSTELRNSISAGIKLLKNDD
jgi:hypothetical protein